MNLKLLAASKALEYVHDGMLLGLGTGTTSAYFVDLLGEKLRSGELRDILGVPTSRDTAERAQSCGVPLISLTELAHRDVNGGQPELDLAVDGADEIDPQLNLIKGLGRALLREKIVETHARRFVVIGDDSKLVQRLGQGPLPVEIVQFEARLHVHWLTSLGCRAELWLEPDGAPAVTDNGNYLARCWFPNGISDPFALERALADHPGIVEHGLFLNMASEVLVAGAGGIRKIEHG